MGANGPLYTSLLTTNKLSGAEAGILYKVNDKLTIASVSSHSKAKPLDGITVGGYYKASLCDVKAKFTKDGVVSACVIKQVVPKVSVTVSGTAAASDFQHQVWYWYCNVIYKIICILGFFD